MPLETHTVTLTISITPVGSTAHPLFQASARLGTDNACDPNATATALLAKAPDVDNLAVMIGDAMDGLGLSCNPE